MLDALGLDGVELSVALVDDPTILALNRTYRRKAKPTDVLAFPQPAALQEASAGGKRLLGDVILSVDTARRQARWHRRTLLAELTMLLAHGLLHLLGHDHRTDAEEREMTARTRALEAAATARRGGRPRAPSDTGHPGGRPRAPSDTAHPGGRPRAPSGLVRRGKRASTRRIPP
jgi:probable rRNA maturation factor